MKEVVGAIHFYWGKTLKSGDRCLGILIQINYLVLMVLNILGKFKFTWDYFWFYIITGGLLLINAKVIKFNKVNTNIDFGNK